VRASWSARTNLQLIQADGSETDGDEMFKLNLASTWRKVCTCLFVALATDVLLTLHPPVTDVITFVLFFAAIAFTAWFGGYGLSLLALVLSWYAIDSLFLDPGGSPNVVLPKSRLAFAYFAVGLAISVLTRLVRTARQRTLERTSEARRALEDQ